MDNKEYPYLSIDKNNPNVKYYIPTCANDINNFTFISIKKSDFLFFTLYYC